LSASKGNNSIRQCARELRQQTPPAEKVMWQRLRNRQPGWAIRLIRPIRGRIGFYSILSFLSFTSL
jgi:very-short-patch-repair endonuclease